MSHTTEIQYVVNIKNNSKAFYYIFINLIQVFIIIQSINILLQHFYLVMFTVSGSVILSQPNKYSFKDLVKIHQNIRSMQRYLDHFLTNLSGL